MSPGNSGNLLEIIPADLLDTLPQTPILAVLALPPIVTLQQPEASTRSTTKNLATTSHRGSGL